MGQQEKPRDEESQATQVEVVQLVLGVLFWLTVLAGFVWMTVYIWRKPTPRDPEYMVSITGVDGLNQEATTSGGLPAMLSPVFNLTVRIDYSGYVWGSSARDSACVGELSTAVVSYGDAFLGKGSVPPFCAEGNEVQERVATAWGQDVVLPRFLQERLSAELERGEASLDVQVTTPADCSGCTDTVLVCNKVKIGGGSSPCRVKNVFVRPAPASGSTSSSQT